MLRVSGEPFDEKGITLLISSEERRSHANNDTQEHCDEAEIVSS